LEDKIRKIISTNEWLNGTIDFINGDLCPEDYFSETKPIKTDDIKELYRLFKQYDNGLFLYKNRILIAKHWNYGAFLYDIWEVENGAYYFEHYSPDISMDQFIKPIEEKVSRRSIIC